MGQDNSPELTVQEMGRVMAFWSAKETPEEFIKVLNVPEVKHEAVHRFFASLDRERELNPNVVFMPPVDW